MTPGSQRCQYALCSCAAGVQNMPGRKGELWGIANLFLYTGSTIRTLDVLDAHRHKVGLHIHVVHRCKRKTLICQLIDAGTAGTQVSAVAQAVCHLLRKRPGFGSKSCLSWRDVFCPN